MKPWVGSAPKAPSNISSGFWRCWMTKSNFLLESLICLYKSKVMARSNSIAKAMSFTKSQGCQAAASAANWASLQP